MIQKKNHTGYRNASELKMEVKVAVIFQMYVTNGRTRKVKVMSIKQSRPCRKRRREANDITYQ